MSEIFYADNYEAITGRERGGPVRTEVISTKAVEPADAETAPAEVTDAPVEESE